MGVNNFPDCNSPFFGGLSVFPECSECSDGEDYTVDIWLVLASYIRPEDVCTFALICRNAWTVTCTAAFWTRLYKR